METIKNNVVQILRQQNKTQKDLAAALGVTVQTLQYYFNGNITLKNLERIADALNVDPWQLLKPHDDNETITTKPQEEQTRFICPHCGKPLEIIIK